MTNRFGSHLMNLREGESYWFAETDYAHTHTPTHTYTHMADQSYIKSPKTAFSILFSFPRNLNNGLSTRGNCHPRI